MNTQPYDVNGVRNHLVPTDEQVTGLLTELQDYIINQQLKAEGLLVDDSASPVVYVEEAVVG